MNPLLLKLTGNGPVIYVQDITLELNYETLKKTSKRNLNINTTFWGKMYLLYICVILAFFGYGICHWAESYKEKDPTFGIILLLISFGCTLMSILLFIYWLGTLAKGS